MTASGPVSSVKNRPCQRRTILLNDPGFVATLDGIVYSANKPFDEKNREGWLVLKHLQRINGKLPIVVLGSYINTVRYCSELYNRFRTFAACRDPRYISYNPFDEPGYRPPDDKSGFDYLYIDKTRLLCATDTVDSCQVQVNGTAAFYDKHHLSLPFATLLGQRIADTYGRELNQVGFPAPQG